MYVCPVCKAPLQAQQAQYVCSQGHSFDVAKKGYVNLLLSHKMRSKNPGDNKDMIAARRAFLSQGHYQPLLEKLAQLCAQHEVSRLLDAGCGEGYYTCGLARSGLTVAGMDISKEGIIAACKRDKNLDWCIASVNDLPYQSGYFDAVLSVFCRVDDAEFYRVLRPGGVVIFVGPGSNHLPALRAGLYEQVRPYQTAKQEDYLPSFTEIASAGVKFAIELDSAEQIYNLLTMTPHYWSTNPEQQQRLLAQGHLSDSADMQIRVLRRDA